MEKLQTTLVTAWQQLQQTLVSGEPPIYMQLLILTGIFAILKGTQLTLARIGAARRRTLDIITISYVFLMIAALAGGWEALVDHFVHAGEGDDWIS